MNPKCVSTVLVITCCLALVTVIAGSGIASDLDFVILDGDLDRVREMVEASPSLTNTADEYGDTPLFYAAKYEQTEIARYLLSVGAKPNAKDNDGCTALHFAAWNGDEKMMAVLVSNGADALVQNASGEMPIHYAASRGNVQFVTRLLALQSHPAKTTALGPLHLAAISGDAKAVSSALPKSGGPDARDSAQWTPLHWASVLGRTDAVALLLSHKANANAKDDSLQTPLHLAASHGYLAIVDELLSHGANVNAKDDQQETPLLKACISSEVPVALELMRLGATVNTADGDGMTPLHWAARHNKELVQALLGKGANPNARDKNGQTSLHAAATALWMPLGLDTPEELSSAYQRQVDIVNILVGYKADVNAKDGSGETPLHGAARNDKPDVAVCLLKHNADVKARDGSGQTPIFGATSREMVEVLAAAGADIEAVDSSGRTILFSATGWGLHLDLVKFLISKGLDITARDNDGNTVLHEACQGYLVPQVAENYIQLGIDKNVQNRFGQTPLHLAASAGAAEIVKTLIARGASVNIKDTSGNTPLDLAIENGNEDAVAALKDSGAIGGAPSYGLALSEQNGWTEYPKQAEGQDKPAFGRGVWVCKLRNERRSALSEVRITCDWYDKNGKLVGSTQQVVYSLAAGESRFVRLECDNIPFPESYSGSAEALDQAVGPRSDARTTPSADSTAVAGQAREPVTEDKTADSLPLGTGSPIHSLPSESAALEPDHVSAGVTDSPSIPPQVPSYSPPTWSSSSSLRVGEEPDTPSVFRPSSTPVYIPPPSTFRYTNQPPVYLAPKSTTESDYLGKLSSNTYDPDSISNPYGKYGNPYGQNLKNPYSTYGSEFSTHSPSNPYATDTPRIYAADGTYLGKLSSNPFDPESISNPYGRYGNPYGQNLMNPYSKYGSPYSSQSWTNPYTYQSPRLYSVPQQSTWGTWGR